MELTVARLMELDILREHFRLEAGHGGLERTVSFVAVQEAPDFYEWVEGGEFILTTWYSLYQLPDRGLEAFLRLTDRVAAIGIKTGRFLTSIPQEFAEIANEKGVPLFEIQTRAKFREVIKAISGEISQSQINLLTELNAYYHELLTLGLDQDNSFEEAMLTQFHKRTGVFCFAASIDQRNLYIPRIPKAKQRASEILEELLDHPDILNYTSGIAQNKGLQAFPCGTKHLMYGHVILELAEPLDEKKKIMANQLATLLTLKWVERRATEQRFFSSILDKLIYMDPADESSLLGLLNHAGLDSGGPFRILLIRDASSALGELSTKVQSIVLWIRRYFPKLFYSSGLGKAVYVLLNATANSSSPSCEEEMWQELREKVELDDDVTLIVGPVANTIRDIGFSYRTTQGCHRVIQNMGRHEFCFYTKYLPHLILAGSSKSQLKDIFLASIIQPLVDYDKDYNTELIKTLSSAVAEDEIASSARYLHIHVNTLRYRLKRIHELTGFDFLTSEGRYILTTAVLLFQTQ